MKSLFSIILLCCLSFLARAKNIYVSNADDANKYLKQANAGDTVLLKAGIYTDAVIKFINKNGTAQQPIVFTAEHEGKVFFEGNSTLNFSGNYIVVKDFVWRNGGHGLKTKQVIEFRTSENEFANNCTVQDCVIDTYNNDDKNIVNTWVGLYGERNLLTRCLLKAKDNRGPTVVVWLKNGVPAHHTISYNYFLTRRNGPDADNGLESLRIGDSKTSLTDAGCVTAFNRFEDCDGEIEIISNKSCHNSYLHNTFINSDGGLTLRHGNNCLCDGNFFDGGTKPLSYGIRIIGEGHYVSNNYFYNLHGATNQSFRAPLTIVNGIVNTPVNGYFQVRRAIVSDNVFVNCATPDIRIGVFSKRDNMTQAPDTLTIQRNLIFDDAGKAGNVYEEMSEPHHTNYTENKVAGAYLKASAKGFANITNVNLKRNGFESIKDEKGNVLASVNNTVEIKTTAGADKVSSSIIKAMENKRYSYLQVNEVGPNWMR
ncbi:polysaccharide lyase 6 family protein [Chitinophagaceae bacterium LWZ2-11]